MGKRRQGRQDVLILTETNSVVGQKLKAEVAYAVSPDTVEAWALDANQQAIAEKSKRFVQVICERTYKPVPVFNLNEKDDGTVGKNVNTIAQQKEDEELAFVEQHEAKDRRLVWVGIIVLILALTLGAIVLNRMGGANLSCSSPLPYASNGLPIALAMAAAVTTKERPAEKTEEDTEETPASNGKRRWPWGKRDTVEYNAVVFEDKTRAYGPRLVPKSKIPDGSMPREYKGHRYYILNLNKEGKYTDIRVPREYGANESPKDLYIALHCEKEVNAVWQLAASLWDKISLTFFYVLAGGLLIVIFLLAASSASH